MIQVLAGGPGASDNLVGGTLLIVSRSAAAGRQSGGLTSVHTLTRQSGKDGEGAQSGCAPVFLCETCHPKEM